MRLSSYRNIIKQRANNSERANTILKWGMLVEDSLYCAAQVWPQFLDTFITGKTRCKESQTSLQCFPLSWALGAHMPYMYEYETVRFLLVHWLPLWDDTWIQPKDMCDNYTLANETLMKEKCWVDPEGFKRSTTGTSVQNSSLCAMETWTGGSRQLDPSWTGTISIDTMLINAVAA